MPPAMPGVRRTNAAHTVRRVAVWELRGAEVTPDAPYYTTTTCPQCEATVDGIAHRYVCTRCGWVSPPDWPHVYEPDE